MARISLNSNIPALGAQRQLGVATSKLAQNFTRLSSGLRINKASDDAAGLSVSTLLTMDKRVTNQAVRNLNDGISYLNVAESALNELSNIVIRISELAEQSANGTLGSSQRGSLQKEVTALQSEYNRIIQSTSFNGKQLLTGDYTSTTLQGGYGTDGQLAVQVGNVGVAGAPDNAAGQTTRVSVSTDGVEGNNVAGNGTFLSISGDGRYIAFKSLANNIVGNDVNAGADIFIRDTLLGTTTAVSVTENGSTGNAASHGPSMSSNGRYVSYHSSASNLVNGDTNNQQDIFIRDILAGTNELISVSSAGILGNGNSLRSSTSDNGRYVVFASAATNLISGDVNGAEDIFIRDRQTNTTSLISASSSGIQGNSTSNINKSDTISADGRYVVFSSTATNLVANDTNGVEDIFVRDILLGTTTLVSIDNAGVSGNSTSNAASISKDGRFVTYNSAASNLVTGDSNGVSDIFVRDLILGTTSRVNVSANEEQANGVSSNASISADGKFVSFSSNASNLVSNDTNGVIDVFVKNLESGTIVKASIGTTGTQTDADSSVSTISADGRHIAFVSTATNLISGDTNGFEDIFLRELSIAGVQQMAGMVVSNQASAKVTLDLAKRYQNELNLYRADVGASTSRIGTFISTLKTAETNYSAAASQIMDADIAEESASLIANNILQRSASSVLAQANQEPALTLQLLSAITRR